jgi:hypothetical protein
MHMDIKKKMEIWSSCQQILELLLWKFMTYLPLFFSDVLDNNNTITPIQINY